MKVIEAILLSFAFSFCVTALELKSPDGLVKIQFEIADENSPVYSVSYKGREIVTRSHLGLSVGGTAFGAELEIDKVTRKGSDATWKPVYGERSTIRDHYKEMQVQLVKRAQPHRALLITFRAYDEGAAFCYTLPDSPSSHDVVGLRETTDFRFPDDFMAWATYTAQGVYTNVPVSRIRPGCERPLVLEVAPNLYAAIAEARLVDYARMKLAPLANHPHALAADLGSDVSGPLPLRTPWRVMMVGDSPGQLLERNDLILNLNDPCTLADTSWIKPGKVIREVSLSTIGGKACIDFAVKQNLQYIEYDAGWYGPEATGDARRVSVNPARPQGGLDLAEVIRYGKARGIGVILYANRNALEHQLDEILPLYRSWGVSGVKYGFVNVGSQRWTAWLHEAIRKAADNRLMVDVHDEYRPTGWSRTYPNLMTQEGIRGDEERQPNTQALTTVFTRMLAGAGDNTICYYDKRVDEQATHAYQLAKAVCLYSPWQFVFWYDRPFISDQVTGRKPTDFNVIGDEPELEFFKECPTVWDDTRVLHGRIGEYAVIARRSGSKWFIGAMNTDEPRSWPVPLTFLDKGRKYVAHVYSDDASTPTRTHVKVEQLNVDRSTALKVSAGSRGGEAISIVPR